MYRKEHCFLLQIHKDTDHVRNLIDLLSKYADVFIHMDLKSENDYLSLSYWSDTNDLKNVFFTKNRIDVKWAHYSQVLATINLLRASRDHGFYESYTLLSGDCFPVKAVSKYFHYLDENKNKNFFSVSSINECRKRVDAIHLFVFSPIFRHSLVLRKFSLFLSKALYSIGIKNRHYLNYDIVKGSQWFTITKEFVDFLLDSCLEVKNINQLKFSNCIDEVFFQTILFNSKFKNTIIRSNLRSVNWKCGNSPEFFTHNELNFNSSVYFARKIDTSDILSKNKIKEELLEKV